MRDIDTQTLFSFLIVIGCMIWIFILLWKLFGPM